MPKPNVQSRHTKKHEATKRGEVPASKAEEVTDSTYSDSDNSSGDKTPQAPQMAETTSLPLDSDLEPDWESLKVWMAQCLSPCSKLTPQ